MDKNWFTKLESEKNHFKDFLKPNNGEPEPFVTYNLKKYFAKSIKYFF